MTGMRSDANLRAIRSARWHRRQGTHLPGKGWAQMLFMVIERFRDNDMVPIYQRLRAEGRMLPKGLEYVDSWVWSRASRVASS
jgi:hypothetical protein